MRPPRCWPFATSPSASAVLHTVDGLAANTRVIDKPDVDLPNLTFFVQALQRLERAHTDPARAARAGRPARPVGRTSNPCLLFSLGHSLDEQRLAIRSAHISTLAGYRHLLPHQARWLAAVWLARPARAGGGRRSVMGATPTEPHQDQPTRAVLSISSTSTAVGGWAPCREQTIAAAAVARCSDSRTDCPRLT